MRGRRWLIWLGAALTTLLVVGILVWQVTASRLRGDVEAGLAQPIRCTGTTIQTRRPTPGERPIPMVVLAPGMRCEVRIRVTNHGFLPVRIQTASFYGLGRHAGPGAILSGPREIPGTSPDAVFAIDEVLSPGKSLEASYVLGFRPKGCDSPGASEWQDDAPQVTISALWESGTISGTGTVAWRGTPASSCDQP